MYYSTILSLILLILIDAPTAHKLVEDGVMEFLNALNEHTMKNTAAVASSEDGGNSAVASIHLNTARILGNIATNGK